MFKNICRGDVPTVMHNGRQVKDNFIDVAKSFVKAQQPRMAALEEHLQKLTSAYSNTAKMYGEDPQKLPNSGEFFALLVSFFFLIDVTVFLMSFQIHTPVKFCLADYMTHG
jgi:hypothetical protein